MVPFVHYAGSSAGLGQATPPTVLAGDPWWVRLAAPFAGAAASRIAHGRTPPFSPYNYPPSSFYFQGPGTGPYVGAGYGGFDPRTLVLLGGALLGTIVLTKALR